ncbi:MAG: ferritin [Synergistaceae bacterium]|jgi:ferritin|nr:ferritin [Synergistaceae bacterium]
MLSEKMSKALNDQVNAELYSAYIYLAMAAYFEDQNLPGAASWMRHQAEEEVEHAMKFFEFINERRGRVLLAAIDKPQAEWESPLAAFEEAFKHEQYVTGRIHSLVELAQAEKDHATASFLTWFVDEQVEEEASVDAIVEKLRLIEGSRHGLFMMDRELGQRADED